MERERRGLWLAYGLWFYFWLVPLTALAGLTAIYLSLFDRWGNLAMKVGRWWASSVLRVCFIPVTVKGLEHLDVGQSYVYAANHRSNFDIFVLYHALPGKFSWLGKKSLFRVPIFGQAIARLGSIPIDRSNLQEAVRSLERAAEQVRWGRSLIVFPEGTRSTTQELLPFKKGVFIMAMKSGQPIVPVTVNGTGAVQPRGAMMMRPGPVEVIISPPIPTRGRNQRQLMAEVRQAITASFDPDFPYGPAESHG
jgi:1-acyl-sn-glycerol-3-phosphate acyltransferase